MSTYKTICVTDRHLVRGSFIRQIKRALETKPWALILREKDLDRKDYRDLAEQILPACRENGVLCLFNSRTDLARELSADGVQLPIALAARLTREERESLPLLGVSVHSEEEVREAVEMGADFLLYGHIFPTQCKPGLAPRGLAGLKRVCAAAEVPVFAIGGISEKNAPACIEAGASGVCMMSRFMTME
ncbi:MAG: thiamine phosphate synthase [Anaerovoracaceae bacterium]